MTLGVAACAKDQVEALNFTIDPQSIDRSEAAQYRHSYSGMLKDVTPSVVSVHSAKVVRVTQGQGLSPHDLFLRRFFGQPLPEQPEQPQTEERKVPQGIGSGVIISADGYILTNNHVVTGKSDEEADEILVRLNDGRELTADIVGRDPRTDIALLKVEAEGLPAITVTDSEQIEVGDIVFAIGNPMGVGLTVTQGIVSATGRQIGIYGQEGYEDFIQTDASINPGNSGGALVDSLGRLVGINSAILSRSGGNIGIGFAIPSDLVRNVATQLVQFGEVRRGFIGVMVKDLTPEMAEAFEIDGKKGVLIEQVEEGLPAEKAGIKRGDVLTKIGDKAVETANDLRLLIAQTTPGSEVEVTLYRDGKKKTLSLNIGDQEKFGAYLSQELVEGIMAQPLDEEGRQRFGIPDRVEGLLISQIDPNSPYSRKFRTGMVIMEINDNTVKTLREAREQLNRPINKLYVYERGRTGYMSLRMR